MITSIILLDIPSAPFSRALLSQLLDCLRGSNFCLPLVFCLPSADAVVVFLARFTLMPLDVVDDAGAESAVVATEDIAINAVEVFLARLAAGS